MSRVRANAELVFAAVYLMACTSSGGVIMGMGAFAEKAICAKLLHATEVDVAANLAFQILTWASCIWSCLHDSLGPRLCAVTGLSLAVAGHVTLALAAHYHLNDPHVYAAGLGLVGGGGNGAFLCSFHFTTLGAFKRTRALRVSLLSTAFSLAAYPLLILNAPSVSIEMFFAAYAGYTAFWTMIAAILFPRRAYRPGDIPQIACPTFLVHRCSSSPAGADADADAGSINNIAARDHRAGHVSASSCCKHTFCSQLARRTLLDLRLASTDLCQARYWGFCLTFSWAALTQQWAGSAASSKLLFPHASPAYLKWGVPVLSNASYLVSPCVGLLIGRTGFIYAAVLVILVMQAVVALLWVGGLAAQWLVLLALAALAGLAYPIQFSYLTMEFDAASYPGLLTVTMVVQGTLGFLAWPLLSEVRPFGCADPCPGNFILILVPSTVLFAWPLWLLVLRIKGRRIRAMGAEESPSQTRPAAVHTTHERLQEGLLP